MSRNKKSKLVAAKHQAHATQLVGIIVTKLQQLNPGFRGSYNEAIMNNIQCSRKSGLQDGGRETWSTYISALLQQRDDRIPTSPKTCLSAVIIRLSCPQSKIRVFRFGDRHLECLRGTSPVKHSNSFTWPDIKNMCIAVGIFPLSCVKAEIIVYFRFGGHQSTVFDIRLPVLETFILSAALFHIRQV